MSKDKAINFIGNDDPSFDDCADAIQVLRACHGLTLTEAIARLRCPLSPAQVEERLESLYDEDFRSDWQYGIKRLLADLTAPKEG